MSPLSLRDWLSRLVEDYLPAKLSTSHTSVGGVALSHFRVSLSLGRVSNSCHLSLYLFSGSLSTQTRVEATFLCYDTAREGKREKQHAQRLRIWGKDIDEEDIEIVEDIAGVIVYCDRITIDMM